MPVQGEKFVGKFMPANEAEFHPKALEHKGAECTWVYNRQLRPGEWSEEGFDGEWIVLPEASANFPFRWAFERDVEKTNEV